MIGPGAFRGRPFAGGRLNNWKGERSGQVRKRERGESLARDGERPLRTLAGKFRDGPDRRRNMTSKSNNTNERGAISILVAVGLVILIGAAAMAIDIGYGLVVK